MVGYYRDLDSSDHNYPGFILENGTVTTVRYPDSAAYQTFFEDINRNLIVGYWTNSDATVSEAFLYDEGTGTFSAIVPGDTNTSASAINRGGVVTVEVDNAPYIYCTRKKTCPLSPSKGISIPEKWIRVPPANIRTVLCQNGCLGSYHEAAREKPANAAAVRAAIVGDPDLQRELRLPWRP